MALQPRPDGSYNLNDAGYSKKAFRELQKFAKRHGIKIPNSGIISHDDHHRLSICIQAERAGRGENLDEPPPRN